MSRPSHSSWFNHANKLLWMYYTHIAALLVGRSWDRFPVVTYLLPTAPWPWGRLSPYWKWVPGTFLGVKMARAWGWQPHHIPVPNVMEIWEPKPPGTLWATPGLLRDSFTLLDSHEETIHNTVTFCVLTSCTYLDWHPLFGGKCSLQL